MTVKAMVPMILIKYSIVGGINMVNAAKRHQIHELKAESFEGKAGGQPRPNSAALTWRHFPDLLLLLRHNSPFV
jgi:hypothetical protein